MRNLLFFIITVVCASCTAQKKAVVSKDVIEPDTEISISAPMNNHQAQPIAEWNFKKEKTSKANEYLLIAQLKLAKDWHIFDFDPGGDGFLIAPDFTFESEGVEILKKEAKGQLISTAFEGVTGDVRYYENSVSFQLLVRSNFEQLSGSVYYQLCDHEKCLAPTEKTFTVN